MTEPKQLTREEITEILHTIKDGSLEATRDLEGVNWWVTENDSEGCDLMVRLCEQTGKKFDVGPNAGEIRVRSGNMPLHLFYAAGPWLEEMHPDEHYGHLSVSRNAGPTSVVVIRTPNREVAFDDEGFASV